MIDPQDQQHNAATQLVPARLTWHGDQPVSRQYHDIYHAPDGAAEVQRVFIEPQCLLQRFAATSRSFTIGELGFGTGLNFAVVAQRFIDHAPASARLHFFSVEKHPLQTFEFARTAARRQPQLPLYRELARYYPPLLPGWHRRHLAAGRICLSVFFGDAQIGLQDIHTRQLTVDAWLLDGFAPANNPKLWAPMLWKTIAALSAQGSTVATFTAVGDVRRSLTDAGFVMRKVDQRPHKRHSLAGSYAPRQPHAPRHTRSAVVVGAGLAGSATAWQIAQRGIPVTLLDRSSQPTNRIAATVLHCRVLPDAGVAAQLRCASFIYSSVWYDQHRASCSPGGVLQFPSPTMNRQRLETAAAAFAHTGNWIMPVDAATASSLAERPVCSSGLYFPRGRAIDLGALCSELSEHPLIDYRPGVTAVSLQTDTQRARVTTTDAILDTDQIILCTAAATNEFEQARYLELVAVCGQIDPIYLDQPPALPLLADGFVVPLADGWGIGATYEHHPWTTEHASTINRQKFDRWWHELTGAASMPHRGAPIRGIRAVASDRRPIVGSVYDTTQQTVPRLLLNTGHGSQGTVSAPLAAECIASELAGEFAPATRPELETMSSLRFRQRQARRGPRHGARS